MFISLACACAVNISMFNAFYFVSFHTWGQKLTIWNFVKILLQKILWCIHYIHWLWHTVCVSWLWAVCHLQKTSSWNGNIHRLCHHVAVKWTFVYLLEFLNGWELVYLLYITITIKIQIWINFDFTFFLCIYFSIWPYIVLTWQLDFTFSNSLKRWEVFYNNSLILVGFYWFCFVFL